MFKLKSVVIAHLILLNNHQPFFSSNLIQAHPPPTRTLYFHSHLTDNHRQLDICFC